METHSSTLAWKISDRGAWQSTVHGVAKSQTQLSDFTSHYKNKNLQPLKFPKVMTLQLIILNTSKIIIGEGNGNPLQYSCLENPMDGEAWQAVVHGVAKSRTRVSN